MATLSSILPWKIPWPERSLVGYSPRGRKKSDLTEHSCCHHCMRKWPCWIPWLGLFGPSSFSASKGSWGCRADAGGSLRSGQKTARGPRLRALSQPWLLPRYLSIIRLAFTQWLACTVHSFMYLFIHFLSPLHPYSLSFPILSLCIHWLFPPPFLCWRAGKIRCQMCTGPGRIGPLSLCGATSFLWSVTPCFHLQITPFFPP